MYVTSTALAARVFKRFLTSKDRTLVRALALNQCGQSTILSQFYVHMWVEFVVGSRLAPRVLLRVLRFSSLHKNQISKFQFDQDRTPT